MLSRVLKETEKLGLRFELARAQYLMGLALRSDGLKHEAVPHFQEAVTLLERMSKEPGCSLILRRSDLKDIYRDALSSSH